MSVRHWPDSQNGCTQGLQVPASLAWGIGSCMAGRSMRARCSSRRSCSTICASWSRWLPCTNLTISARSMRWHSVCRMYHRWRVSTPVFTGASLPSQNWCRCPSNSAGAGCSAMASMVCPTNTSPPCCRLSRPTWPSDESSSLISAAVPASVPCMACAAWTARWGLPRSTDCAWVRDQAAWIQA